MLAGAKFFMKTFKNSSQNLTFRRFQSFFNIGLNQLSFAKADQAKYAPLQWL